TEGKATYDYLKRMGGHDMTICDQKTDISVPAGVKSQLGSGYLKNLDEFDVVVRTAGLQPAKILAANPGIEERITTHINLFFGGTPTFNIIGVTGTKGKGTTSSLITAMLQAVGKDVQLGGNIGVPPLTFLDKLTKDSWVVLELSSFQLIDLRYSPHIAACLMIVPEHLNWHADFEEYITAKAQLFAHQKKDDMAVYFAENDASKQIAASGKGRKIPYFAPPGAYIEDGNIMIDGQVVCPTGELRLLGKHNWQNVCAAVTVIWQITQDIVAMRKVLTTFSGLEHRLEFVREVDDVRYYDDSFGTTPETAMVAIEAFPGPKVVILGGSDKGAGYDELARTVAAGNVRTALIIGETGPAIKAALQKAGFTAMQDGGNTMPEIVKNASAAAKSGDVVLLSTACASFDLFENYKDRGNQFKTAVKKLS
ncbi:MAG TPA: UDP-N-acetylmuramoyl-L-alanine--D-glutamate ligase, partial [Candidatus Saccharimonadales bacterium]|nr:UDP-N-acetylmuramoyl-L-alanine--D-glutamate ligase [Candidatus Saccharimonadales bacterium]